MLIIIINRRQQERKKETKLKSNRQPQRKPGPFKGLSSIFEITKYPGTCTCAMYPVVPVNPPVPVR